MYHAEDLGRYYRIPCDNRDLNYDKFFSEGDSNIAKFEDYTSHNSTQLSLDEVIKLLSEIKILELI